MQAPFTKPPRELRMHLSETVLCGRLLISYIGRRLVVMPLNLEQTDYAFCSSWRTLQFPFSNYYTEALAVCDYRSVFAATENLTAEIDLESTLPLWTCPVGGNRLSPDAHVVAAASARGGPIHLIDRRTRAVCGTCSTPCPPGRLQLQSNWLLAESASENTFCMFDTRQMGFPLIDFIASDAIFNNDVGLLASSLVHQPIALGDWRQPVAKTESYKLPGPTVPLRQSHGFGTRFVPAMDANRLVVQSWDGLKQGWRIHIHNFSF